MKSALYPGVKLILIRQTVIDEEKGRKKRLAETQCDCAANSTIKKLSRLF